MPSIRGKPQEAVHDRPYAPGLSLRTLADRASSALATTLRVFVCALRCAYHALDRLGEARRLGPLGRDQRPERTAAQVDGRIATLQTEVSESEGRLAGLYWMVEEGVTDLDDIPCARIADLKLDRKRAKASPDRALSARHGPIEINRRRSKRSAADARKHYDGRDAFPESLAALSRRADRGRRRGDPHHRGQSNSRGRHRRAGRRVGESSQMCTEMARPERFELPTPRFVVWCSIQLSYGRTRHFRKAAKSAAGNVGAV